MRDKRMLSVASRCSVDDVKHPVSVWNRHNGSKEVFLLVGVQCLPQIVQKSFNVMSVPSVISLAGRNFSL